MWLGFLGWAGLESLIRVPLSYGSGLPSAIYGKIGSTGTLLETAAAHWQSLHPLVRRWVQIIVTNACATQGEVAKEIRFVCVARLSDKAVVAQHLHVASATSPSYLPNVRRILNSPGWSYITTDRLELSDGDQIFNVIIDSAGEGLD